jgi:hypothetical protein
MKITIEQDDGTVIVHENLQEYLLFGRKLVDLVKIQDFRCWQGTYEYLLSVGPRVLLWLQREEEGRLAPPGSFPVPGPPHISESFPAAIRRRLRRNGSRQN